MKRKYLGPVLLLLALAPRPVRAQPDPVAQLKQEGTDAFLAKDWPLALRKFEEAYAISKDPTFLFNEARTLEALQELPRAMDALDKFEELASPELKAKVVGLDDIRIAIRQRVATLQIHANVTGAEIRLNDRVVQKVTSEQTQVRVTRGALTLSVVAEGYFPCTTPITDLQPAEIRNVHCTLASRATQGILIVKSTNGAAVTVDGASKGFVPFEGMVATGAHQIELRKEGCEFYRTSVLVKAGETRQFDYELQKSAGLLSKWWFWTGIGVLAVGTGVTIYALTKEKDVTPGSISPGVVRTGIAF
jgi:hypothetical protein